MNIDDLSTQLLYTTVPICANKKGGYISKGTGFIFSVREDEKNSIPLLITNYHVLEGTSSGYIEFHVGENGNPTNKSVKIPFDDKIVENNKLGELDLIAIPLASTFNELSNKNQELFYRTVEQNMIPTKKQIHNFSAMESVTFVGYPSGLYDDINKLSIIRQGITATPIWNEFKGEKVFLIDAGVFPGSSGSPVFIYNQGSYATKTGITIGSRLLFVGVISQTMRELGEEKNNYLDLGIVINSLAMYDELEKFINRLKSS